MSSERATSEAKLPRYAKNVKWQSVVVLVQTSALAVQLVLLSRALGPGNFGVFGLVVSIISVALGLLDVRAQDLAGHVCADGTNASNPQAHGSIADLFVLETGAKIAASTLSMLAVWVIAPMTTISESVAKAAIVGIPLFLMGRLGSGVATGMVRMAGHTQAVAKAAMMDGVLRILVILLVLNMGGNPEVIAIAYMAAVAPGNVILLRHAGSLHGGWSKILLAWQPAGTIQRLKARRREVAGNTAISWSDLMTKDADVLVLASMLGPASLGIYKLSKSLASAAWRIVDPFLFALVPELVHHVSNNDLEAARRRGRGGRMMASSIVLGSSLVATIALVALSDSIFGAEFAPIKLLTPIMLAGLLTAAFFVWAHPMSVAVGRPEFSAIGAGIASLFGIALMIALVPSGGMLAAAVSWALMFALTQAITAALAASKLKKLKATLGDPL